VRLHAVQARVGLGELGDRLGYAMTTAVMVGYISLVAVAVQTGIIMVIFIRAALDHRRPDQSYIDAVIDGSTMRLRPKLMTVSAIILSLLPVMLSSGSGMEIMKRRRASAG
jgi:Cu(I)/Ag(I) efflux system membrane protein CusA/SilA